jgi:hypothetical protein
VVARAATHRDDSPYTKDVKVPAVLNVAAVPTTSITYVMGSHWARLVQLVPDAAFANLTDAVPPVIDPRPK